jgi:SAM-dependent methyltransferase
MFMGWMNLDELDLFDATRAELRSRLAGRFPADFDLENTITAYAYWVCTVMRNHGREWESVLQEYVDFALRDAILEAQAEEAELELLRRELACCASPLLDVGAGWGRFSALYQSCGLHVFYAEPSELGCCLLRRDALVNTSRCLGQSLCFPGGVFRSVVIGWVLHHDAPDVPAKAILTEIARVMAPEGRLLSVEPLSSDFQARKWRNLVESAGFEVEKLESFFDLPSSEEKSKRYAFLAAVRQDNVQEKL